MKNQHRKRLALTMGVMGVAAAVALMADPQPVNAQGNAPDLSAMPEAKPGNATMIELGK